MFGFLKKRKGDEEKPHTPDVAAGFQAEQPEAGLDESIAPPETGAAAPAAISPEQADSVEEAVALAEGPPEVPEQAEAAPAEDMGNTEHPEPAKKRGLFARLKKGLAKTRDVLNTDVRDLVPRGRKIDDDVLEELETLLLTADVGVDATTEIIDDLTGRMKRKQLGDADALFGALRDNMLEILRPVSRPLVLERQAEPYVILMVGINGAGKTTTIGKLAKRFQNEGKAVMLAAGDTFRAAAVEQLQTWGERNNVPVVAQQRNADPASVAFDAVQAAKARKIDVLIVDTAGRLHTQSNLMEELKKIKRVMGRLDAQAPHEVLLVLDGGIGQNAVAQAEQFHRAVGVSGLALTKLDGTAKGGVVFAIAKKLGLPIRLIGVGEGIDDLRDFNAEEFVEALLLRPETEA